MQLQVSDSFLNERTNRFNRSARGIDTGENLAFSPNGRMLAAGNDDGTIPLWDVRTRRPLGELLPAGGPDIESVAFGPDGRTLASGDRSGAIRLWDVRGSVRGQVPPTPSC